MRGIILATAITIFAPMTFAQTSSGTMGAPGSMGAPPPAAPPSSQMAGQPDPNNCGTPDEPKPCPPLPRHPLKYYPANKQ